MFSECNGTGDTFFRIPTMCSHSSAFLELLHEIKYVHIRPEWMTHFSSLFPELRMVLGVRWLIGKLSNQWSYSI